MKTLIINFFKSSLLLTCTIVVFTSNLKAQSKTEVLVLGTIHLGQINDLEDVALSSLLEKLKQKDFDAIGIESMSTELLNDIASRKDSTYFNLLESRGNDRFLIAAKFQKKLGLTFIEAQKKINSLLALDSLTREDRVSIIRYFLASGDLASAVLQFNYLDGSIKIDEELIDAKTMTQLNLLSSSPNEVYSIAVKLAKLQGQNKIEYIDNLQDEPLLLEYFPEFMSDYLAHQDLFKDVGNSQVFKTLDNLKTSGLKEKNLLPLYEYMNSVEFQQADFEAQWEVWLKTNFSSKSDLSRYTLWEMRNLQIAANIMRVAAFYPGQRILIIIGGSHKLFIEKYLSQSPVIELLNFE